MTSLKAFAAVAVVWIVTLLAVAFFVNRYDKQTFQLQLATASRGADDTSHVAQAPVEVGRIIVRQRGDALPKPDGYFDIDSLDALLRAHKPITDVNTEDELSPFGGDTTVPVDVKIGPKTIKVNAQISQIADPMQRLIFLDVQLSPIPLDSIPVISHTEYVQEKRPFYTEPEFVAPTFFILGIITALAL